MRGYVIFLPTAQTEVNESHIHEVPKNNGLLFISLIVSGRYPENPAI